MKFNDTAPKIETPLYVKPGVDKQAVGDLLKNLTTTGEKVYSDYQVGSLRDEINKEVDTYEKGYRAPEEASDAWMKAEGARLGQEEVYNQAQLAGGEVSPAFSTLEKEYQTQLSRFQSARSQGKISEEELVSRINKTTREFVNRNPWMEQELYASAQQHLKNTGVADILKYRTDLQASAQKETRDDYKFMMHNIVNNNVPGGWYPGMPMNEMITNWTAWNKEQIVVKGWKDYDSIIQNKTKKEVTDLLPSMYSNIYAISNDKYRTWANGFSQLGNPGQITAQIAAYKQDGANEVLQMKMRLSELGVSNTPEAKEAIASFEKSLNDGLDSLVGVADGKKAAEILKNRADTQSTMQKIGVMSQVNLAAIDAFKDILPFMRKSLQDRLMTTMGIDKIVDSGSKLFDASFSSTPQVQEMIRSGNAGELFGGILKAGNENPNNPSFMKATKILVDNFNKALPEMKPEEQHAAVNTTLSHIAQNQQMFAAQSPDPGLISGLKPQIDFHMGKYAPGLFSVASESMKTNPGTKVIYDVTPSGGLVVYSNDTNLAKKINAGLVSQVNNALDAWANVNGISREKAAPAFYQEYFSGLVGGEADMIVNDPDIGGSGVNPTPPKPLAGTPTAEPSSHFNVRTVEEAKKAFDEGKMSKKEYDIVAKFFQGK